MSKTMGNIAFRGWVELDKAVWDNQSGMYAIFRLEQDDPDTKRANPFKRFTKARKGRVGTRFVAAIYKSDEEKAYHDEVMLKGWSDGTTGWKVTFWVQPTEDGLHPFMGYDAGTEFACAMTELDDDDQPVDQDMRDRVENAKPRQRLSQYAAQLCKSHEFIEYLTTRCGEKPSGSKHADEFAAEWIRQRVGIESRSELDRNPEAATKFHEHVRKPYQKWYNLNHG